MFTSGMHIVTTCTNGGPLCFWEFFCESACFHSRVHGDGGDGFPIVGRDACEDSLDKRGVCIGEPDGSLVTECKVNSVISVYSVTSVKSRKYFLFHRFNTADDIRAEKITPGEFSFQQFHFSEIPGRKGSTFIISPDLDA